jgi:very-short-patch-repair endonuclease
VWIVATAPLDRATWLAAARLVLPVDAVLCGLSAADAHGVDVRQEDDVLVCAAFADRVPRQRRGMKLRQLKLESNEVVRRNGWLVTNPLRTAFDCSRWLPLVEAVVLVDAMAHAGLITLDALLAFAGEHPGIRWVRRVADVVRYADARSESPMESRLRLLLVRAGLDGLQPQYIVRTASGGFVARVDLAYVAARVIVEYDGAWHWKQRRADDRRRDRLRDLGWTVIVVSAEDYYGNADGIVQRVDQALRTAAA